jgi:hypothetical protein
MTSQAVSEIAGTGAIWVILAVAVVIALVARPHPAELAAAVGIGAVCLSVQAAHFGEELVMGFARRFPETLGLAPWSTLFFVGFNLSWLAAWTAALFAAAARRATMPAAAALWFLGLAAIANGFAHPILAFAAGGYFPGVATAPFLGLAGLMLVWRLRRPPG